MATSAPEKWGTEFVVVGPDTAPNDDSAAVASTPTDGFVVAWNRYDGATIDAIVAQRYDPFGAKVGSLITVENNFGVGNSYLPDVAAMPNGNFVVAYQKNFGGAADVRYAVYNASGGVVKAPTALATSTTGEQTDVAVAWHSFSLFGTTDYFLAVWEDASANTGDTSGTAIRAQYLLADGSFSGSEFVVNTQTTGNQVNPDVAASFSGSNVVVWTDMNANAGDIKLLTISNVFLGATIAEMTVNSTTAGLQDNASAAILANGNLIVVWESGGSVIRRSFDGAGVALTTEQTVSLTGTDPHVVALPDGGFTISFVDNAGDVQLFSYLASGVPSIVGSITANTTTTNTQDQPDIVSLSDGRTVVVYTDDSTGSNDDTRGQILDTRGATITGTTGNDYIVGADTGTYAANTINGLAGNDTIYGMGGADTINGGDGDDILVGGAGADSLDGGNNNDTVIGGLGGGNVTGGAGDDVLWFYGSSAVLSGGAGFDYAIQLDGTGQTRSIGALGIELYIGNNGFDVIDTTGSATSTIVYGGAGNDFLTQGDAGGYLFGQAGVDTLIGGAGTDFLLGGTETDNLLGQGGNDIMYIDAADGQQFDGGDGVDYAIVETGVAVNVTLAGRNVEVFIGNTGGDTINATGVNVGMGLYGFSGDDIIVGGSVGSQIFGQNGADTLVGGAGNDVMLGGADNDTVSGGGGDDLLLGEALADTLNGGLGNDVMYGGLGNDIFTVNASEAVAGSVDTIADFGDVVGDNDTINFVGITQGQLTFTDGSGLVVIGIGAYSITVIGATTASIQDDLLFT